MNLLPRPSFRAPRFKTGAILITTAARDVLDPKDVVVALVRHAAGEWGDVSMESRDLNEASIALCAEIMSVHESRGRRYWIVTQHGHRETVVTLPDAY